MGDVFYVRLDIVYSINHQLNETISRKSLSYETVKSKVIISLFETVRLSVSISPRNLYNSLKSIKEIGPFVEPYWPFHAAISARSCLSSLIRNQDGGTQTNA